MNSLIINAWEISGFFSNYLIWIDNIKYCEENNLKPIMNLEGDKWFYTDGRKNLWEYYFQNFNDNIIEGDWEISNFLKNWNITTKKNFKSVIWDSEDKEEIKKNRLEVYEIVKKIVPSDHILKKINSFVTDNFKNKKILGVHIRATDYGFGDLTLFYNQIKKYENDFDCIFVASDNFESINYIKSNFDNVYHYETQLRMNNASDNCLVYNVSDGLKHGEDVLIECTLLSKCNHLICINSNVALCALYMNPEMSYDLIHRSAIGG